MTKGKKIYFGVLILGVVLVTVFYVSYAFFTSKVEGNGKLNIVAGTLDYKIESSDLENNSIEVAKNNTKTLIIKITSLNKIDSKYELYYNLSNNLDKVEVKYINKTKDSPKGIIGKNEEKEIEVIIINNSSDSIHIEFGVHGGLTSIAYDDISKYGNKVIEKKDDFTLAYTYTGSKTRPDKFPNKGEGYIVESISCTGADGVWNEVDWSIKFSNITSNEIYCNAIIKDDMVEVYGDSIQTNYQNIYTNYSPTTPITKTIAMDDYYSGNYNYMFSLYNSLALSSSIISLYSIPKDSDLNYFYLIKGGNNTHMLVKHPYDCWISFEFRSLNTNDFSISNFKLIFQDEKTLTIEEAINNGYIKPLVLMSSFSSGAVYVCPNFYEAMLKGQATANASSLYGIIILKINSTPLIGYNVDSSKDWNSTYDGMQIRQFSKDVRISTQPLR